jgi:hypothetical protein
VQNINLPFSSTSFTSSFLALNIINTLFKHPLKQYYNFPLNFDLFLCADESLIRPTLYVPQHNLIVSYYLILSFSQPLCHDYTPKPKLYILYLYGVNVTPSIKNTDWNHTTWYKENATTIFVVSEIRVFFVPFDEGKLNRLKSTNRTVNQTVTVTNCDVT